MTDPRQQKKRYASQQYRNLVGKPTAEIMAGIRGAQVRTLADMTADEIARLEIQYGCQVVKR